jgi:hypothetical protein
LQELCQQTPITPNNPVGAGLLAMAAVQATQIVLTASLASQLLQDVCRYN